MDISKLEEIQRILKEMKKKVDENKYLCGIDFVLGIVFAAPIFILLLILEVSKRKNIT